MKDKIDFPINVRLTLRKGGTAELWKFEDGRWWGRLLNHVSDGWMPYNWYSNGQARVNGISDIDILPPKRKVWLLWSAHEDTFPLLDMTYSECVATAWKNVGKKVTMVEEP